MAAVPRENNLFLGFLWSWIYGGGAAATMDPRATHVREKGQYLH